VNGGYDQMSESGTRGDASRFPLNSMVRSKIYFAEKRCK
jgi:hypothetical protein